MTGADKTKTSSANQTDARTGRTDLRLIFNGRAARSTDGWRYYYASISIGADATSTIYDACVAGQELAAIAEPLLGRWLHNNERDGER